MRHAAAGFALLLVSAGALAQTTIPNTFTAGSPARASEVNANFTALANAANALDARLDALEAANGALTAADVAGTYRVLSVRNSNGSLSATRRFFSSSGSTEGTVTFNANGTFTGTFDNRSNSYSGKAQTCASGAANTSSTSINGTPHNHQYTAANCDQNADAFTSNVGNNLGQADSGTWTLGPGNAITVSAGGDAPLTLHFDRSAGLAFAVEVNSNNDPSNPGREFGLSVLVKQ